MSTTSGNTPRTEEKDIFQRKEQRWIEVQRMAFMSFMNDTLKRCPDVKPVTNFETDLKNGVTMFRFTQALTGKGNAIKYDKNPTIQMHMLENLNFALEILKSQVSNITCDVQDIYNIDIRGDKMLLGLLYLLFKKYRMAVAKIVDQSGRTLSEEDAMLAWARETTKDYSGIKLDKYIPGFNDGKGFLALCHAYTKLTGENTFDYEEISKQSPEEVLAYAYEFANTKMGIDKLLLVDEVASGTIKPSSLAVYVSSFHHAFETFIELQKLKNQLGNASGELKHQQRNKEDLINMNLELTKEIDELKKKKEELDVDITSLDKEIDEIKTSNKEKEELIKDLDEKIQADQASIKQFEEKINEFNGKNSELERTLKEQEAWHKEGDEKKMHLTNELNALQSELKSLEEELKLQEEMKNGKDITSKCEEQSKKNRVLEQELSYLEESKLEHLTATKNSAEKLEKTENEKKDVEGQLSNLSKTADEYTGALAILKKQIELHTEDLARWSEMLEGNSSVGDVESVIAKVEAENESKTSEERVKAYLEVLKKEEENIEKLYKTKVDEAKAGGEQAQKKKPITKKPAVKK
ncbi:alpha-actinin, putative [Entamoeba invadens IP1]|uniref:Alpha-actinin, putative n=1 Tax=Entamoeba invadens IP1 TaxID=370355 RepID=A0A0A1U1Y7_ENTIV|nr:alpha-actinin, putative [Entamoeba invadens IP1]ELP88042.1 alpha-actinin, putative [Entamoeba invadens IP1]|eukprot:XP_004254813.1 alpha-actinin, putative [Entamoeba invadens IP1]